MYLYENVTAAIIRCSVFTKGVNSVVIGHREAAAASVACPLHFLSLFGSAYTQRLPLLTGPLTHTHTLTRNREI